MIWLIVAAIVWGFIWGLATDAVINNKGYDENWFWWGFFFGLIAFLVAVTKPEINSLDEQTVRILDEIVREDKKDDILNNGGWECYCGKINSVYTGTCGCGRTKTEVSELRKQEREKEQSKLLLKDENIKLDNLKKLKELLDLGVITQEEFEIKKKQFLEV